MKEETAVWLVLLFTALCILLFASRRCSWKCGLNISGRNEGLTVEDQQSGKAALEELENLLKENSESIPHISEKELDDVIDKILVMKVPTEDTTEKLDSFNPVNTKYWPQYYYSFPYNEKAGGAWPPGMYSRLYYWSPGFYTGSGWSYYLRPGLKYKNYPRNRWVRNTRDGKHSYYYLSNGGDYQHDAADYTNLPLDF